MTIFWKGFLSLAIFLFVCSACAKKKTAPSMAQEDLVSLLTDVHLAEAALQNVYGVTKDSLAAVYYSDICTIHRLSRPELDKVMAELRENPLAMSETYREVIKRIERRNQPDPKD